MPVWVQRIFLIIYVLFCIELGLVLVALPWTRIWSDNALIAHWPTFNHFLRQGFVRGAVSGLGFVDIWLGIQEAVNYQDRP